MANLIFWGIFYIKQLEITLLSFWGLLDLYALDTVHVPTLLSYSTAYVALLSAIARNDIQ